MKLSALIVTLLLFAPTMKAQEVVVSPVAIFDYLTWNGYQVKASRDEGTKTLKEFIHLVYDRMIGRPWGEERYWEEVSETWEQLHQLVCDDPSRFPAFCSLPTVVNNAETMGKVVDALGQEQTLKEFQDFWATRAEFPLRLLKVSYPNGNPLQDYFSFVAYPVEAETLINLRPKYWDLTAKTPISVREAQYLVIHDLDTYQRGFDLKEFAGHWAHTTKNQLFIDGDKIRQNAAKFAARWKFVVRLYGESDDFQGPTLSNAKEYHLVRLARKLKNSFEQTRAEMLQTLKSYPDDHRLAQKALKRFAEDEAQGEYPIEVYQHLAYETFREAMILQSTYFHLAKTGRPHDGLKRKAMESLLLLQDRLDSDFFLYLVYSETPFPRGWILSNLVNANYALSYFYEHLRLILQMHEYKDKGGFARFVKTLQLEGLFNPEYLKEYNPKLLERLRNPQTGELIDVTTLPLAEQKEVFTQYLLNSEGKIIPTGMFRLVSAVSVLMTPEQAQEMAEIIHEAQGFY